MSIDIRRTYAEKMLGLYRPNEILVLEQDCEVETVLDILELKAKGNLIIKGKLLRTKWSAEAEGGLIMESKGAVVDVGGHIRVKGLLKAEKIRAGKFIEADIIEAEEIESGRGYNIITNSLRGKPKTRGRVIKKDP